MNNEEQSQINALLSGLKMKLHAYQVYRDRANAVFNDYVANKKVPHFTPADTAKMRSVVYLSEIEYEHAISIVDDVERFFNHGN
jgi:hypothetical protein